MKKILLVITLIFAVSLTIHAQQYLTDISIREQVKQNLTPGLKYAGPVARSAAPRKGFTGSSLAHAIREGKEDGMKIALATGSSEQVKTVTTPARELKLPSDAEVETKKEQN